MALKLPPNTFRAGVLAGTAMCCASVVGSKGAAAAPADSQPTSKADPLDLQEIVVSATRRDTRILEIPYNISAVSGENLSQRGITDITDLSQVMPGLNYPNQGAGRDAYSTPIIRGLNLTPTNQNFYPLGAQSPVSTYIGDTPVSGRFPLNDLQRVEVLRGPQGTLYGAGAMGGTIRLIPNEPDISSFDGRAETSLSTLDHSDEPSYSANGMLNVPLNETMAFRISAQYKSDAGFIDDINAVRRSSNTASAPAILANPADVAGSSSIRDTDRDINWSESYGGRAALLAQVTDTLRLILSFDYSHVDGGDNPAISTSFRSGPDIIDPRITVPTPGRYQELNYILQPYHRDSSLPVIDASWELGFATLSSNTGYFDSKGSTITNQTFPVTGFPPGVAQYYLGVPTFPRYITPLAVNSNEKDVTEEVRLVSHTQGPLEYVAGAYFSHLQDAYTAALYAPGASAWDAATPAPTLPIVVFPNSGESYYTQTTGRSSIDRALYGELTYHVNSTIQVTGGGRYYWQSSSSSNYIADSLFGGYASQSAGTFADHGALGKLNASWSYFTDHRVYATFSQGYRPGGSNGIPLTGPLAEAAGLLTYKPDKANNFEIGAKGTFGPAFSYAFDIYSMDLKDTQISTVTPVGWPVVVNSNGARTRGFELELNGRIIDHLTYNVGYSNTDAVLTDNFNVLTHFGSIGGADGQQLPGSPRNSATGSLTYDWPFGTYNLGSTASFSYKGSMQTSLTAANNVNLPSYTLTNLSCTLRHEKWRVSAFINNLTNERAITSATAPTSISGPEGALAYIEPPREIGMRIGFDF